ncbi:WD40 repeat-like protein [Trichodelitschia bisporula]|uniref:WD40 repeat-like protein n=1 Tax=Trichodelitschia bisporula TaxID=703511 RepID=A0A6G1HJX0_9PEZI|nr:WD40 repeat-like protein [Trichodelitschia bisporula]
MAPELEEKKQKRKRKSTSNTAESHRAKRVKSKEIGANTASNGASETLVADVAAAPTPAKQSRKDTGEDSKDTSSTARPRQKRLGKDQPQPQPEERTKPATNGTAAKTGDLKVKGAALKQFAPAPEPSTELSEGVEQTKATSGKKSRGRGGRKKKEDAAEASAAVQAEPQGDSTVWDSLFFQAAGRTKDDDERRPNAASLWAVSEPSGGVFLNQDPVFSADEKHLLLATQRGVHVYSTATSLLVRTLAVHRFETVSCYALSAVNPEHVYIVTEAGVIMLWDWLNGKELRQWRVKAAIHSLVVAHVDGTNHDTLFTLEGGDGAGRVCGNVAVRFPIASRTTLALAHENLWPSKYPLIDFKVLENGRVVVAASLHSVVIGSLQGGFPNADGVLKAQGLSKLYTWRDAPSNAPVVCIDAQTRSRTAVKAAPKGTPKKQQKMAKWANGSDYMLDIAIGRDDGSIHVYPDLEQRLAEMEKAQVTGENVVLAPRILHWHRYAVNTVKWSKDGNYVISGGKETVLVLWQLETGKKQELPHLVSHIKALTVSPNGASYGVRLGDNSVMVLSTTELQPTANIPGIQAHYLPEADESRPVFAKTPAIANPGNPNELLLAVPAFQETEEDGTPASCPYLQTYNIFTNRHVSRQALTRNNATIIGTGPESNKLDEPTITHMLVSGDGYWLATVEEWTPPTKDVKHLSYGHDVLGNNTLEEERARHRETYLKFWQWNETDQHWMLETRIDVPHQSISEPSANRIFDLVANPGSTGFATIGEDGFLRIWAPKTRMRNGVLIRGTHPTGKFITWKCQHEIELERPGAHVDPTQDFPDQSGPTHGRLAYSNDGSLLAAVAEGSTKPEAGLVQFIDATTGTIRATEANMFRPGLAGLAFAGRYLVLLSQDLRVWDVVSSTLVYGIRLALPERLSLEQRLSASQLAVSRSGADFAIALPLGSGLGSAVAVFKPTDATPLVTMQIGARAVALVALGGAGGYAVLDTKAEVRAVTPRAGGKIAPLVAMGETEAAAVDVGLEAETEAGAEADSDSEAEAEAMVVDGEDVLDDDKPVVRPQQLAEALDVGPAFALPPVRELFGKIMGLYARKSRVESGARAVVAA